MDDVWYVDDDGAPRTIAKFALEKKYARVRVFSDGAEAREAFENGDRTRLLISDTLMPGLSGPGLILYARDKGITDMKILLVSTSDDYLKFAPALKVPALKKPFSPNGLLEVVEGLIPPSKQ